MLPSSAMRWLVIAISTVSFAPLAAAEAPVLRAGLDYTVGYGGEVEALELGWRLEAGGFIRVGRLQATVALPFHPEVVSENPARDSGKLSGIGFGARLGYRRPLGERGVLGISAGITKRWFSGSAPVQRKCSETRDCIAGFYSEVPSYEAWAPQLRAGIGVEGWPDGMVVGATFDIIIEAIALHDVPPYGIRSIAVMGGATLTIGGGPKTRRRAQTAQNL